MSPSFSRVSINFGGLTTTYGLLDSKSALLESSCHSRTWKEREGRPWYDPGSNTKLAAGAFKNWASRLDNRIVERERSRAMLMAKASASASISK